jgi:hypothetical protein
MTAEPDPFENVQPIPHIPGTYLLTDGSRRTYPRPTHYRVRPATYDAALHKRIQQRPSIFLERR